MKRFAALLVSAVLFVACGDDSSSSASAPVLDEDLSSSSVESNNVSSSSAKSGGSSVKSSSSVTPESSSSSVVQGPGASSGINSVEGSSSSRPTDILEPEITVNETCTEVGACDAMVKTDVSTWHFVRKDAFGDDAEYIYRADGRDLIVTIKNADGSTDSKTYSMYNMESEVGVEMAFNAAKSTCKDGGGNDNKVKVCVKDTVKTLPKCNTNLEGVIGIDTTGIKVICRENEWQIDVEYGSLMDDRDGQSYKIVKIGDQWWMAENLNYADSIATPSLSGKSWCFNNEPDSCTKYGRLYTWAAAIDSVAVYDDGDGVNCGFHAGSCTLPEKVRGICPSGWHMPDTTEWNTLFDEVGGKGDAAALLRSLDWYGSDAYGFSVLPAGYRHDDDGFLNDDYATDFWSVTVYGDISAYVMSVSRVRGILDFAIMAHAFSVRCLKDDP